MGLANTLIREDIYTSNISYYFILPLSFTGSNYFI